MSDHLVTSPHAQREMTPEEYALMLRKIMASQHLTINQAATKLGVSRQRIVEILKGDKPMSEPECICPMMRGGGIQHELNCAYIAAKKGYKVVSKQQQIVLTMGVKTEVPIETLRLGPSVRASYDPVYYATLKNSLKQRGQLVCLTVKTDGTIVDGAARYRAMVELGFTEVAVEVVA